MNQPISTRPQVTWRLRQASASDREGILALRSVVFQTEDPEKRDPAFWDWEFLESPSGPASLYVAEDGERIVGHYAIIPQRFVLSGEACLGSIVVDVMTHPDYRFQGMFKKLGLYALNSAAGKISFATGYPIRKEVMPGHLSIGWMAHAKLPVLLRPLHLGALSQRFSIPGGAAIEALARGVERAWSRRFHRTDSSCVTRLLDRRDAESMAGLASRAFADISSYQVRDTGFFDYRYFGNPAWRYRCSGIFRDGKLVAYVVVRDAELLATSSLAIVDLACEPGEDAALVQLLRLELDAGRDRRLATAGAMIARSTRYFRALRRAGLYPGPHQFTLILFALQPDLAARLTNNSSSWFLTWGDTDDV